MTWPVAAARTGVAALIALAPAAAAGPIPEGAAAFTAGQGLVAHLGSPTGPPLPAGLATCAGCHGADGSGGREGAAPAPPIRWSVLSAPTPERPPYDDSTFARLLTEGIAPDGRTISARMPRFQMSGVTLAALRGHLEQLDAAGTEGLGPDTLAVRLPAAPDAAAAARAVITAFNAAGGSYGRRVVIGEPAFLDLGAAMDALAVRLEEAEQDRLTRLLAEEPGLRPLVEAETAGRLAGRLDEIGHRLPALLASGRSLAAVGPEPAALEWALAAGRDGAAAADWATASAALALLHDAGRHPTRSSIDRALAAADLRQAVAVYRYDAGQDE